jgi:gamma-glutamylaminecyclotransferase
MIELFVYGTLKRGFPLHERGLTGARFLGPYRTVSKYPLYVAGPRFTPMMLDEPGVGMRVEGELYEIGDDRLSWLDAIEHIAEPGNLRAVIAVEPLIGGPPVSATVYLKQRALDTPLHTDYVDNYQDQRFIPPGDGDGRTRN